VLIVMSSASAKIISHTSLGLETPLQPQTP
jgi:hypothetical protein